MVYQTCSGCLVLLSLLVGWKQKRQLSVPWNLTMPASTGLFANFWSSETGMGHNQPSQKKGWGNIPIARLVGSFTGCLAGVHGIDPQPKPPFAVWFFHDMAMRQYQTPKPSRRTSEHSTGGWGVDKLLSCAFWDPWTTFCRLTCLGIKKFKDPSSRPWVASFCKG